MTEVVGAGLADKKEGACDEDGETGGAGCVEGVREGGVALVRGGGGG